MAQLSSASAVCGSARELQDVLASFDPALLTGDECAEVVRGLAGVEKACAAAKTVTARRAGECEAHAAEGFADVADWLARTSGSSVGRARSDLRTAERLEGCPRTAAELRAGGLSLDQANEITKAEKERPGVEDELVELALRSGLARLKEQARAKRLEGIDPDELSRRQHAAQRFRRWINRLGNVAFSGELPPEVGMPIMNRLDAETDRLRRAAKQEAKQNGGTVEPRQFYAAEAFANMMTTTGTGLARTRADVVFVVDYFAFRRGHTHPGETCHIVGGGPVPVDILREIARDAFLKVAFHDGTAIHTVRHLGRHIPAELRTALELGDPPQFGGVTCADEGCERRHGLEWDHVEPWAHGGPTSVDNLEPRCWPHHQRKTRADLETGLIKWAKQNKKKRGPP